MSTAVVVTMLTPLLGIQPVTTHLYLPALPTLTAALHTDIAAAQVTPSALILAFGVAQLVCGALAASLSGFVMMLGAFGVSQWLGHALNGTVHPLTLGVAAFSAGSAAVAWTLVQRHGKGPAGSNAFFSHTKLA